MRRAWTGAAAGLVAASCILAPHERLVGPNIPPATAQPGLSRAVAVLEARPSYEPSVVRGYEPAASIEWDVGGTEEGFHILGGALVVERIDRDQGDAPLHVRVRLRNTTPVPVAAEVLLAMLDWDGRRVISDRDVWRPILVPPLGRIVVSNYALLPGATRFVLYARPASGAPPQSPAEEGR